MALLIPAFFASLLALISVLSGIRFRSVDCLISLAMFFVLSSDVLAAPRGGSVGSARNFHESKTKTRTLPRHSSTNPVNPFKFKLVKPKFKKISAR